MTTAENIIGDMRKVPIDTLNPHPGNARRSALPPLVQSLRTNGQYRPVVVNKGTHTGRPAEILAGHHLVRAARELGWQKIGVQYVDVDDSTATGILLVDNRSADLGGYDNAALLALLQQAGDLTGTGYSAGDLDDLAILLERQGEMITDDAPEPYNFDFQSPWRNADRRVMVLDVPVQLFAWLQQQLEELATQWGLATNVDVVVQLVAEASGSQPPEVQQPEQPAQQAAPA